MPLPRGGLSLEARCSEGLGRGLLSIALAPDGLAAAAAMQSLCTALSSTRAPGD